MKPTNDKRRKRKASRRRLMLVPFLTLLLLTGCTRKYWRNQADDLAYDILSSKYEDPISAPYKLEVRPLDPRSRFADPYDPDCPPLPPDDPEAHEYMHWVYGMRGYKHWHDFGDTLTVENPFWLEPYGMGPETVESNFGKPANLPEIRNLSLVEAVELSYIHSREYQLQLETVYLNALALTIQRFQFDVQFFGILNRAPFNDTTYQYGPAGVQSVTTATGVGANQYLPTGGQWLVELTNNTLWLFGAGNKSTTTSSLLSYSLVQPLLSGGGRRFALENLTQSERNVLYALRNFARYRQGFFVSAIVGGGAVGTNFANTTASGATGTNFTTAATGATIANIAGGGGGGANVGGYLGLIQLRQQILNLRDNIRRYEEQLKVLRAKASQRPGEISEPLAALPEGFKIPDAFADQIRYDSDNHLLFLRSSLDDQQVEQLLAASPDPAFAKAVRALAERDSVNTMTKDVTQLESQLLSLKINLLNLEVNLQSSYDSYKIQMGLPTDMVIAVDESMLKPFELIDGRLARLENRITSFVATWARIDDELPSITELRHVVDELATLRDEVKRDGLQIVEEDLQRLLQGREQRLAMLELPEDRERFIEDVERDERLLANVKQDLAVVEARLETVQALLAKPEVPVADARGALRAVSELREQLLKITQGLSVLQIDLRVEQIPLMPFDMDMVTATAMGLEHRTDLMNARAQVMDTRRKVEVTANQLQAMLNLVANGNISTPTNAQGNVKPFDFREDESAFQVGVSFTSPIQLVVQRNNYRSALIFYEQARRNYMLVEDTVKQSVRLDWRQLAQFRKSFELARHQIRIAAVQYDQAVEKTAAPVIPGNNGGDTIGLDLLQALQAILTAQNNLINVWVQYETNRLTIYREMGIMDIDEYGFWTDEYYQRMLRDSQAAGALQYSPISAPPQLPSSTEMPEFPQDGYSQSQNVDAVSEIPPAARVSTLPRLRDPRTAVPALKAEPASAVRRAAEDTDADSAHADSAHADSAHADSAHADSAHADSAHADSAHADSAHADSNAGIVRASVPVRSAPVRKPKSAQRAAAAD